jgi:thiol-disulfide isomerase/thioredoxin
VSAALTNSQRQKIYEKERMILEGMIEDLLLQQEAGKRGISVPELVSQEIEAKIKPLTDEDIEIWYEANKERVKNRPLDSIRDRLRPFLEQERAMEARMAFLLPLKKAASIKIILDPPRVPVTVGGGATRGPEEAPVTIIEFTDFQCGFCKRTVKVLNEIAEIYGDKVRVVFRDFPLFIHPEAQKAHEAAQCARDQGKFWPYHDMLFENQRAMKPDNLKAYAEDLGLDTAKFNACLDDGVKESVVKADMEAGREIGVSGTPAFYINGRFLNGAQPFENFERIIDDELGLKGIPIPKKPERESLTAGQG